MGPPSYMRSVVDRNVVTRAHTCTSLLSTGFRGAYGYLRLCFYCPGLGMYGLERPRTTLHKLHLGTRFEPRTSRGRRTANRSNAIFDSHVHLHIISTPTYTQYLKLQPGVLLGIVHASFQGRSRSVNLQKAEYFRGCMKPAGCRTCMIDGC